MCVTQIEYGITTPNIQTCNCKKLFIKLSRKVLCRAYRRGNYVSHKAKEVKSVNDAFLYLQRETALHIKVV